MPRKKVTKAAALAAGKKYLDQEGLAHLVQKNDARYVHQEEGKGLSQNDFTDEYKKIVDDLNYKPIAIDSFANNKNTVEIGSTVTDVTLTWAYNKKPKSAKLDNEALDVNLTTKTLTGQSIK